MLRNVLNDLATHPCGNLRRVAERFLSKSRLHRAVKGLKPGKFLMRTIHIPHVRQGVRVRLCMESKFLSSESRITKAVLAEFVPGLITVCLRGLDRYGVVRAMVHEMRHAQQLEILGHSKFYDIVDCESDLSPLEIDAYAVEVLEMARNRGRLGRSSWKQFGYPDPEMERLCTVQARAIRASS
jgi:hypothetical protein